MVGGGGPPIHTWHAGDNRASVQPSRRFLIKPGAEDHRKGLGRSSSARRSRRSSEASTSYRPRSARSSRDSELSSWTVPSDGRASSAAHVPKAILLSPRDKARGETIRFAPDASERFHGAWGGGQPAGAPSGHGTPRQFPKRSDVKYVQMLEREASLDYNMFRGPGFQEEKSTRKPDFTKDKISRTAWKAPPGYSGFKPGVYAQNVHGRTYRQEAKDAIVRLQKLRGGDDPLHDERPARWIQPSTGRQAASVGTTGTHSRGCEVPGYSGFVPRSYAGNLVGVCVPRAAKMGWQPGQDGPNPPLILKQDLKQA